MVALFHYMHYVLAIYKQKKLLNVVTTTQPKEFLVKLFNAHGGEAEAIVLETSEERPYEQLINWRRYFGIAKGPVEPSLKALNKHLREFVAGDQQNGFVEYKFDWKTQLMVPVIVNNSIN